MPFLRKKRQEGPPTLQGWGKREGQTTQETELADWHTNLLTAVFKCHPPPSDPTRTSHKWFTFVSSHVFFFLSPQKRPRACITGQTLHQNQEPSCIPGWRPEKTATMFLLHSQQDQLLPLRRWPQLATATQAFPEAHPHSARRGCTSTNSIPLAGMSSKQAFTSVRWDLKCCCTRVFAVFSLCPKFSLPNPTSAMWWTSLFLANYIREAFRWYHLSSHPLVSLLTD